MKVLSRLIVVATCFFAVSIAAVAEPQPESEWSARKADAAIVAAMHEHLFDPDLVDSPAFRRTMADVTRFSSENPDRAAYIDAFNRAWQGGPFSHVRLDVASTSASELADRLDHLRVGGNGARLEWHGDIAILTVNTMMGLDTIEQIDAAYDEIVGRSARALVIDLRENEGGAFAVRPLVSHSLSKPLDAGLFLAAKWAALHKSIPDKETLSGMPSWEGWSLKSFWSDVERVGLLHIVFEPATPTFSGPVYVLTSKKTASAAELAADALQANHRAIVVGEVTASKVLSQKMFDIPGGLQLYLPIADYYSLNGGRIEGKGVHPDVAVPAEEAMNRALDLADDKR